jgi:hypothetical protein
VAFLVQSVIDAGASGTRLRRGGPAIYLLPFIVSDSIWINRSRLDTQPANVFRVLGHNSTLLVVLDGPKGGIAVRQQRVPEAPELPSGIGEGGYHRPQGIPTIYVRSHLRPFRDEVC